MVAEGVGQFLEHGVVSLHHVGPDASKKLRVIPQIFDTFAQLVERFRRTFGASIAKSAPAIGECAFDSVSDRRETIAESWPGLQSRARIAQDAEEMVDAGLEGWIFGRLHCTPNVIDLSARRAIG